MISFSFLQGFSFFRRFARACHDIGRTRVTTSGSIRYIIDAAGAFKLSWKYRPAVRVINVPPPYKVLNFRSARGRNISRNTATAAQRNAAVYQSGENYSAKTKMLISADFIARAEKPWSALAWGCFYERANFTWADSTRLDDNRQ